MPDLWMDVDTALSEVPVNILPLIDDTDFKTREEAVAYNAAGLELIWHFTTPGGATTATVVTPTTAGDYDWAHQDGGMYTIEIPASGGASINNDTEGVGWFTGVATGVLPWRGPTIGFRAAALNDALIEGGDNLDVLLADGAHGGSSASLTLSNVVIDRSSGDAVYIRSQSSGHGIQVVALGASQDGVITTGARYGLNSVGTTAGIRGAGLIAGDGMLLEGAGSDLDLNATTTSSLEVNATKIEGADPTDTIRDSVVDDATRIDASALNTASAAVGSDGSGLTEAGGTGDQLTAIPWNAAWDAEVQSEVEDGLAAYDPPTTDELVGLLQLLARSDAAIATDRSALLTLLNADEGSGVGDYDNTSEALEAIRDRGDAAWTTGGGGGITDILNVQPLIPQSIDLADTATYRLGLMLFNALDDLPTTTEITPGTISIDRKAIGGTSWSAVVTDAAMSELAGLIYYDEVFDSGTGYAEGDSIRITFKSQLITVSANDYEISDSNGRIFYTEIRQTERGTDSAATAAKLLAYFQLLARSDAAINTDNATELNEINADGGSGAGDYDNQTDSQEAIVDTGITLSSATLTNIADAILKRDWTAVTGEASRSVLNALRFLRNKWTAASGTLTVYKEDDTTTAWTSALTTDAAADPVTESDPT